jgi:hypothetical protein
MLDKKLPNLHTPVPVQSDMPIGDILHHCRPGIPNLLRNWSAMDRYTMKPQPHWEYRLLDARFHFSAHHSSLFYRPESGICFGRADSEYHPDLMGVK